MKLVLAVVGTAGPGSIVLLTLILARLTQKWEVVTKTRSHYRLLYLAAALLTLASLARLVRIGYLDTGEGAPMFYELHSWFYLCFYYIPLIVGATLGLVVTWQNWGWILRAVAD